jgi:hypothetical protein
VTSADGLITATELTQDTTDMAWFTPMLAVGEQTAALISANRAAGAAAAKACSCPVP